jgi:hypothetical protein
MAVLCERVEPATQTLAFGAEAEAGRVRQATVSESSAPAHETPTPHTAPQALPAVASVDVPERQSACARRAVGQYAVERRNALQIELCSYVALELGEGEVACRPAHNDPPCGPPSGGSPAQPRYWALRTAPAVRWLTLTRLREPGGFEPPPATGDLVSDGSPFRPRQGPDPLRAHQVPVPLDLRSTSCSASRSGHCEVDGELRWAALQPAHARIMLALASAPIEPPPAGGPLLPPRTGLRRATRPSTRARPAGRPDSRWKPGPKREIALSDPDGYCLMIAERAGGTIRPPRVPPPGWNRS